MTRFLIAASIITFYTLIFEFIIYKRWNKRLKDKKWIKTVSWIYWGIAIITKAQFWLIIFVRRSDFQPIFEGVFYPYFVFYISWMYSFSFMSLIYFALLFVLFLTDILWSLGLRLSRKKADSDSTQEQETARLSMENHQKKQQRKKILIQSGHKVLDILPFASVALSFTASFGGSREVVTENVQIRIKNMHNDLEGFKILQISDIHIGQLINEEYLKMCKDIISSLKADLLIVTGDIIDNNSYFLPLAGRFFHSIKQQFPYGAYGVMGNHDYIDYGDKIATQLTQSGLRILRNEMVTIRRGKGKIQILGMDYPNPLERQWGKRMKMAKQYFKMTSLQKKEYVPTIVLNHHPSDFAFLQKENIDLVLSGHTHGGQIRLSNNRNSPLSFASLGLDYYIGHYKEKGTQLYVNRGLGHWMPVRINCPPEITVFEMISSDTDSI